MKLPKVATTQDRQQQTKNDLLLDKMFYWLIQPKKFMVPFSTLNKDETDF